MVRAITAFWAWSRFSASSKAADLGPSMTASATSTLRSAGSGCIQMASSRVSAMRRSSEIQSVYCFAILAPSSSETPSKGAPQDLA